MQKPYSFVASVAVLFLFSLVSGYSWNPKLKEQSLDTFLFLAPSGLIKNLNNPESPFKDVYLELSGRFREGFSERPELLLIEVILLTLAFYTLAKWRKKT